MLWKWSFNALGQHVNLLVRMSKPKDVFHFGIGNRTKDGYCLFIDYDDTPLDWIREEISYLQANFEPFLGAAYLFETKNGIHVIFLEKHPLGRIITMLECTSCDKEYRKVPMLYGRKVWVLRQSNKQGENITYIGVIHKDAITERSRPHAEYLMQYCKVPDTDIGMRNLDDEEKLVFAYYYVAGRNN